MSSSSAIRIGDLFSRSAICDLCPHCVKFQYDVNSFEAVFVNRNGLRWRDPPKDYGPHKTLYNRWKRWGEMGVFLRMMEGLAAEGAEPKTLMIDATYLKAHRTASSLRVKKGISGD